MRTVVKWTGAIALSILAHAGGAALLRPGAEEVLVAGGEVTEIALIGNAFEDTIEAGDPDETIDPVEEAEPVEAIEPVSQEVVAETAEAVQPQVADVTVPAEDLRPVIDENPMVTAAVAPVEEIEPIEEPEKKPEPEPKKVEEKKLEKKVEKPKPKPKKIVRKKPGVTAQTSTAQVKGKQDGAENGTSAKATGKGYASARQAGNAAVSNYPGKVRSRLSRAIRYPSEAKRERLRGTALVRFTVSQGGNVSGVSLARSAGSPILDKAALATVSRAAPFPKIPDGAGRSSWTFTVPVSFKR